MIGKTNGMYSTNVIFFVPGTKYFFRPCGRKEPSVKRRKFLWVVTLGLLSTGASLIEPLIYREAINDVAGLFVRQAKENAQKDLGLDPEETEALHSMVKGESAD